MWVPFRMIATGPAEQIVPRLGSEPEETCLWNRSRWFEPTQLYQQHQQLKSKFKIRQSCELLDLFATGVMYPIGAMRG